MSQQFRYSARVSTEYIYTCMVLELIILLGLYTILYFSVYKPYFSGSQLYSKLIWGIFAGGMFIIFALTFAILNGYKYWIDKGFVELWFVYRPKKRRIVLFEEITDIIIRRTFIASNAFNFGTIVLFTERNKKKKIAMRLIGIKFPNDVYLDLMARCNLIKEGKELSPKELLL